jgi:hypothetical protein
VVAWLHLRLPLPAEFLDQPRRGISLGFGILCHLGTRKDPIDLQVTVILISQVLNYAGAELLRIGAAEDLRSELGLDLNSAGENERTAEILENVCLSKSKQKLEPLLQGLTSRRECETSRIQPHVLFTQAWAAWNILLKRRWLGR